jgi:hypothetical protein
MSEKDENPPPAPLFLGGEPKAFFLKTPPFIKGRLGGIFKKIGMKE